MKGDGYKVNAYLQNLLQTYYQNYCCADFRVANHGCMFSERLT